MTLIALLLVTVSAFTHAFWNFLSKRQNPQAAFFLMASIASAVILSPILVIFGDGLPAIPLAVWGLIAATGAVQAVYYIFLAAAYRSGDLSHAYPLARSLPVVLVALVSVMLGRGSQIHPLAYVGFAAVTIGCILLPVPKFSDIHPRHYRHKWVLFALLAAVCITGYTLLDDQSLRILRSLPETPLSNFGWALLFGELEAISISLFLTVFLLGWGPERRSLMQARGPEWRTAAVMGLIITSTYGLVLLAMAYVSNVSYVLAFRQLSIPIGAALGILVRKEAAYPPKLVGIGVVVVGLILVVVG
ncbi:MAG: EamA family transporter [Chloroflexi bacterium]|nr:EamA family transporter [Chloroflexota bacterium]